MPYEVPGRLAPTPKDFDPCYRGNEGRWRDLCPADVERLEYALRLIGDVTGKDVLDLGGGVLLGRAMSEARRYVSVDYSEEACRLCRLLSPWAEAVCMDVMEYLKKGCNGDPREFDVTVCMGVLEYLPFNALRDVATLAPSEALVFYGSCGVGYLDHYHTRISGWDKKDVISIVEGRGWRYMEDALLYSAEHMFARFERTPQGEVVK